MARATFFGHRQRKRGVPCPEQWAHGHACDACVQASGVRRSIRFSGGVARHCHNPVVLSRLTRTSAGIITDCQKHGSSRKTAPQQMLHDHNLSTRVPSPRVGRSTCVWYKSETGLPFRIWPGNAREPMGGRHGCNCMHGHTWQMAAWFAPPDGAPSRDAAASWVALMCARTMSATSSQPRHFAICTRRSNMSV